MHWVFMKPPPLMSDILSSASILVGILTALLGLFYAEIQSFNELTPEIAKANNKANYTKGKTIRNSRLHPLVIGSTILTMVFIPEFINQISNVVFVFRYNQNEIRMDHYSTVNAAFVIVTLLLFIITIWIWTKTISFYFHLYKFRPL